MTSRTRFMRRIEAFGLRVATAKARNGRNQIAVLVSLDQHRELPVCLHLESLEITLT